MKDNLNVFFSLLKDDLDNLNEEELSAKYKLTKDQIIEIYNKGTGSVYIRGNRPLNIHEIKLLDAINKREEEEKEKKTSNYIIPFILNFGWMIVMVIAYLTSNVSPVVSDILWFLGGLLFLIRSVNEYVLIAVYYLIVIVIVLSILGANIISDQFFADSLNMFPTILFVSFSSAIGYCVGLIISSIRNGTDDKGRRNTSFYSGSSSMSEGQFMGEKYYRLKNNHGWQSVNYVLLIPIGLIPFVARKTYYFSNISDPYILIGIIMALICYISIMINHKNGFISNASLAKHYKEYVDASIHGANHKTTMLWEPDNIKSKLIAPNKYLLYISTTVAFVSLFMINTANPPLAVIKIIMLNLFILLFLPILNIIDYFNVFEKE